MISLQTLVSDIYNSVGSNSFSFSFRMQVMILIVCNFLLENTVWFIKDLSPFPPASLGPVVTKYQTFFAKFLFLVTAIKSSWSKIVSLDIRSSFLMPYHHCNCELGVLYRVLWMKWSVEVWPRHWEMSTIGMSGVRAWTPQILSFGELTLPAHTSIGVYQMGFYFVLLWFDFKS